MADLFDGTPNARPSDPGDPREWRTQGGGYIAHPGAVVEVRFPCPTCGETVYSEGTTIPEPNYAADKVRDSDRRADLDASCEGCGRDFSLEVVSWIGGSEVSDWELDGDAIEYAVVAEAPPDDEFIEEYLDAATSNPEFSRAFREGALALRRLAQVGPEAGPADRPASDPGRLLDRLLYAHAVTLVEAYLSGAFVQTVLADPVLIGKLVEAHPKLGDQKVSVREALDAETALRRKVKGYLAHVVYHRLDEVRRMYKSVLDVELPDTGALEEAIETRHDVVHRNGKTKEGEDVAVDRDGVLDLLGAVEAFVGAVDRQLGDDGLDF